MQLSVQGWEIFFNVAYTLVTAVVSLAILFFYKTRQPIYYGFLVWGLGFIFCACFFLGLYGESLETFMASKTTTLEDVLVKERLVSNLKILVFIVPGVMAGIAANLLTEFLLREKPRTYTHSRPTR